MYISIMFVLVGIKHIRHKYVELPVLIDHSPHIKTGNNLKNWDVTPTLTMKKFLCIPKLLHEVELERESHGVCDRIKNHVMLPSDHHHLA